MKKTSAVVEQAFDLESDPEGKARFTVRQAAWGESRQLRELGSTTRYLNSSTGVAMEQDVNNEDVKAKAIYLTLSSFTGVTDDEGNPVEMFVFELRSGRMCVKNEEDFLSVLQKSFTAKQVDEMYKRVLEVNPQWAN